MNIGTFRNQCKKACGKLWDDDKVFICKTSGKDLFVILADNNKLIKRQTYCEEYTVPPIAAAIKHFLKTGKYDGRLFYELYGWKGEVPEKWSGVWAAEKFFSKEFTKFLDQARKEHPELGIQEVARPDGLFKEMKDI